MIRNRISVIVLVVLPVALAGCGQGDASRAAISGEVTLDGQPLEQGSILFVPIDGAKGSVSGGPIENGRYQLPRAKGAAVGWNRVEIRSPRNTGKKIQYAPGTAPSMEVVQMVARRFNTESSLKAEVKPEQNTANFDVASK